MGCFSHYVYEPNGLECSARSPALIRVGSSQPRVVKRIGPAQYSTSTAYLSKAGLTSKYHEVSPHPNGGINPLSGLGLPLTAKCFQRVSNPCH
ncbi:hypothetical protein PRUPE_5G236100 [Prunus persica]|uniref:Uncharacterized protein n=1 Tax=Prunus persica TaxID=3760 RepID=A0A251PCU6_PRUPE|nr:hypothetical protein PRUPE_5G236100 [Prunus persica]